jgi:hypothetical protein
MDLAESAAQVGGSFKASTTEREFRKEPAM